MPINSNVLLKAIVPNTTAALQAGVNLGTSIRNAPLLRKQNEQKVAQNEQTLAKGDVDMGDKLSSAIYSLVGDVETIPMEAINPLMSQLEAAGFPIKQDDRIESPETISNIMGLAKRGKGLLTSQKSGLASATTTTWPNGTTLFNLPNAEQKLIFQNREITDPAEFAKVIKNANKSGAAVAGSKAYSVAENTVRGTTGAEADVIDTTVGNLSAEEQARVRAIKQEQRAQDTINAGLSAAPQYNDVSKGLDLIDEVSQGGLAVRAKAVTDFFGTTSQNVGDLNRTLASTVLQGLAAFTGAISEGERKFVESMSASLSQGAEVNRGQLQRLKNIYTTQIKKAQSIAKRNEDFQTLDSLRIDLGDSDLGRELFPKSFIKQPSNNNQSNSDLAQPEDLGDGFSVEYIP